MSQSNAARQRAYRKWHLEIAKDSARLHMIVSAEAKHQLERLARHAGVSQRAFLEQWLAAFESRTLDRMSASEKTAYLDVTK